MKLTAGTETFDLDEVEALIFDLDGTLVESEHVWAAAKSQVSRSRGRIPSEADLARFVGRSVADFVSEYLGIVDEASGVQSVDRICEIALRRLGEDLREIPGASNLVKRAHAAGLRIAICSSAPLPAIQTSVRALGIGGILEVAVSGAGMRHGKPHKQPYVETLKQLNLRPFQTIAFEDSHSGIRSASAAGIPTIALGRHPTLSSDPNVLAMCGSLAEVVVT